MSVLDDSGHIFTESRRWEAWLHLEFGAIQNRTVLTHMDFGGPLRVQRLFYPEEGSGKNALPCHGYILHPPGGMVSGDHLRIGVKVGTQGHALLTTPS